MIVLVGASASGKTELSKILFKTYGYKKVITTTTREIRPNEVNHIDYHFLSIETFKERINEDLFYEFSFYQNNYYGIQKKDVFENGLVIVDPNGANTLMRQAADIYVVYVEASEALRTNRMLQRGEKQDVIANRIHGDAKTFDLKAFERIDLHIYNESISLESLAETVHQAYQNRKNRKTI